MLPKRTFVPVEAAFPFEGLDTMTPSTQLPPGGSPNTINATTFRGSVKKRLGYTALPSVPEGETVLQLINYQTSAGVNWLIAVGTSHIHAFNGTEWTDVTTTGPIAKLTISGSNGWSVTAGSFLPGDFVAQFATGASGVWLTPDSTHYYIAVTFGVFQEGAGNFIFSVATNPGGRPIVTANAVGTLTNTGTDPLATTVTLAKFALASGWIISAGNFNYGDGLFQESSLATGVWFGSDGTYYYVQVVSGTFNLTNNLNNTAVNGDGARLGTLSTATPPGGSATTTTKSIMPVSTGTIPWFGSEANYVDSIVGADITFGRSVVVVDGANWPVYWNGLFSTFSLLPVNLGAFCTAKTVGYQNSYLVFGNIQTWTDFEPRSVAWSDTGNFQEWLEGNSGVLSELGFDGEILRMIPYGGNLTLFTRQAIGCLCYISSDVIFGSQIYVSGIDIVGPQAVVFLNPFMVYASQDDLYVWDGGRSVSPLADRIALLWRDNVDHQYLNRTKLFWDPTLNQVRFVIPTSATTIRVLVVEAAITSATFYDLQKSSRTRWFEHTYADRMVCFALYNTDNASSTVNVLNPVFGSDNGNVFVQEGTETDDNTSLMPLTWDTPDLLTPKLYQSVVTRWLELEFEAMGTVVSTYFSVDQGQTWTFINTSTLTSTRTLYKHYFDATGRFLRLRFFSNAAGGSFELSWYRVWLRPGGPR